VADKRCSNGHLIDATWDICPYCPPDRAADVAVVRPARHPVSPPKPAAPQSRSEAASAAAVAPPPPIERTSAVPKLDASGVAEKRYVVGWLVSLNGPARGDSFDIRLGRNVIGREPKADVRVTDEQASAHHADLVYRPEERRFILMDHNSTNGTFVNDEEIEPRCDLLRGDVIRIGSQKLMFIPLVGEDFDWNEQDELR
jgi:hypothetical protein